MTESDLENYYILCETLNTNENYEELINALVIMADCPYSKGDSILKNFVIKIFSKNLSLINMFIYAWNNDISKMLPNSMRRAFKQLIENSDFETLNNIKPYKNISLKNVIKMTRPRPFKTIVDLETANELYNNGFNIYSNDICYNKNLLQISFDTLQLNDVYHYDVFKILLNK